MKIYWIQIHMVMQGVLKINIQMNMELFLLGRMETQLKNAHE